MMDVLEVATLALRGDVKRADVEALVASIDIPRLRAQMVTLGICEGDAPDVQVAKLYFSRRCSAVSPNAFFDEAWYVAAYPEVGLALQNDGLVSGFVHFIQRGLAAGLWPNAVLAAEAAATAAIGPAATTIDAATYLQTNPAASAFLGAFPCLSALEHYNSFGRFLGYQIDRRRDEPGLDDGLRVVAAAFDPAYYRATYLADVECDDPLQHYLRAGTRLGHSPNAWFDERWYRAFYPEVQAALDAGWLPSGFFHYLYSGRNEGRQPRFDLTSALEARMPGVTIPALIQKATELEQRLEPTHGMPQLDSSLRRVPAVWIIFPTLNPDIMFGGYRALLWLVVALIGKGFAVHAVCLQEEPNIRYFLLREGSATVRAAFAAVRVFGVADFSAASYGPADSFMAYSAWDLPLCARLAARTNKKLPVFLVQEYEPVFYDNGSNRAICEAIYATPHFAIINSAMLCDYLRGRQLGVFSPGMFGEAEARHVVFEHRIGQLPRQTVAAMRARSTRLLVLYARPEAHAARNVFEIAALALRKLCSSGFFGPEWRFEGVGALSKLPPLCLGNGHELVFREKGTEAEYAAFCASLDIGVSLMYAPHPSVVPFEFATTGAMVVTNTYENRTAAQLEGICANIVPCALSVAGVAAAIQRAVARLPDAEGRVRNALVPSTLRWEDVFTEALLAAAFGCASPPEAAALDTVANLNVSRPSRRRRSTAIGSTSDVRGAA
jgi:hypothetical protein